MSRLLITVGSWEERFILGYERIIETQGITHVLLFSFKEYGQWNRANLDVAKQVKDYDHVVLSFGDPKDSWLKVAEALHAHREQDVIFDMTTTPRDIIWTVLNIFETATGEFTCIYNKPGEYGKWLSRNPGRPRIVYKLGGELQLGCPTKLLVLPGYDAERVKQLINTFETV